MNDFRPAGSTSAAPSGAAGGSLTGTYPNPTIATIPSAATATTQSAADNSTKLATTAYTDTGLALKANLASPTLTGTPLSTTAAADTNTTQIATTAYVVGQGYAKLASPTFTGTVTLPAGTVADSKLNSQSWTAADLGFSSWMGDPNFAQTSTGAITSGTFYVMKMKIPTTFTLANFGWIVKTGGTMTTVATATVSGTQTAPGSGSFTLTTSSVSGYPSQGIATIGSQIVAYSAWTTTSMTVRAGGYTPGAVFTTGTTITSNTNGLVLFDSTGAFVASTVDLTASGTFTGTGFKQSPPIPANPSLTAGSTYYVGIQSTGGTPIALMAYSNVVTGMNAAGAGTLTGASLRFGVNGTGLTTGMPSAITPASAVSTAANSIWIGLA